MRSTDQLFQIVQLIRGRRLTTAAWLAERLEVSERTIYRYVATLQQQGVPIEGEAGVGYRLGRGFELPPLMFSAEEAKALVAALRVAEPWLDAGLAQHCESALSRILSVLPTTIRIEAEALRVFAPPYGLTPHEQQRLQECRDAAQSKNKVQFNYRDASDRPSNRLVRPLGCFYWGKVWTLAAWCESRNDFRSFRLDRIDALKVLPAKFIDETGHTLADMLRLVKKQSSFTSAPFEP